MKKLIILIIFIAINADACCCKRKLPHFGAIKNYWDTVIKEKSIPDAATRAKTVLDACEAVAKTHPKLVNLADDAMKADMLFLTELQKHHADLLKIHPEYATFSKASGLKFPKKDAGKSS